MTNEEMFQNIESFTVGLDDTFAFPLYPMRQMLHPPEGHHPVSQGHFQNGQGAEALQR